MKVDLGRQQHALSKTYRAARTIKEVFEEAEKSSIWHGDLATLYQLEI